MRVRLVPEGGPSLDVVAGRLAPPVGRPDQVVALGPGALGPGLINAHDHLHRNHFPRLGTPPYPDAYAWGRALHAHYGTAIRKAGRLPPEEAFLFGALKNLLGGVTACVHHDPWHPCLGSDFPLRVVRTRVVHSLEFERDPVGAARAEPALADQPLCLHLAEGVTRDMADEVRRAEDMGLLGADVLAVHLVGTDADGIERLTRTRTAVVWCPTSNEFLFGRTAPAALLQSGADVLLGTDSLLTGDGTMLDELAAARRLGTLPDDQLMDAVGRTAARRLGMPPPTLTPEARADLVLWRRPPLEATAAEVGLVLVGGRPRYGDACFARLFSRMGVTTEPLRVGGIDKLIASPMGTVAHHVAELTPATRRVLGAAPAGTGFAQDGS